MSIEVFFPDWPLPFHFQQYAVNVSFRLFGGIPTTKYDEIKEKERVTSTLQSNGYPKRFTLDASKPKLPFKDITTVAERVLENHGNKVAFKPYQTISQMF